jgi:hypothetical protein
MDHRRRIGIQFDVSVYSPAFSWPDDTPTNCPPQNATPKDMTVFRFTKNEVPAESDFSRTIDTIRGPTTEDAQCDDFSLSVLADVSDIPIYRKFVPGFKRKRVAVATLNKSHGLLLSSPNLEIEEPAHSHHDWWVPIGVNPLPLFTGVEL